MSILNKPKRSFIISWDNPIPANSSKMIANLKECGRVTKLSTSTSVLLSVKPNINIEKIRDIIKSNLNKKNGRAFYVNERKRLTFHIDARVSFHWKRVR